MKSPGAVKGELGCVFFMFDLTVSDKIEGTSTEREIDLMEGPTVDRHLTAYKHNSCWQCIRTLRIKHILEMLLQIGHRTWAAWEKE